MSKRKKKKRIVGQTQRSSKPSGISQTELRLGTLISSGAALATWILLYFAYLQGRATGSNLTIDLRLLLLVVIVHIAAIGFAVAWFRRLGRTG